MSINPAKAVRYFSTALLALALFSGTPRAVAADGKAWPDDLMRTFWAASHPFLTNGVPLQGHVDPSKPLRRTGAAGQVADSLEEASGLIDKALSLRAGSGLSPALQRARTNQLGMGLILGVLTGEADGFADRLLQSGAETAQGVSKRAQAARLQARAEKLQEEAWRSTLLAEAETYAGPTLASPPLSPDVARLATPFIPGQFWASFECRGKPMYHDVVIALEVESAKGTRGRYLCLTSLASNEMVFVEGFPIDDLIDHTQSGRTPPPRPTLRTAPRGVNPFTPPSPPWMDISDNDVRKLEIHVTFLSREGRWKSGPLKLRAASDGMRIRNAYFLDILKTGRRFEAPAEGSGFVVTQGLSGGGGRTPARLEVEFFKVGENGEKVGAVVFDGRVPPGADNPSSPNFSPRTLLLEFQRKGTTPPRGQFGAPARVAAYEMIWFDDGFTAINPAAGLSLAPAGTFYRAVSQP